MLLGTLLPTVRVLRDVPWVYYANTERISFKEGHVFRRYGNIIAVRYGDLRGHFDTARDYTDALADLVNKLDGNYYQ